MFGSGIQGHGFLALGNSRGHPWNGLSHSCPLSGEELQVDHMITDNGSSPLTTIPVPVRAERVILLMDTRGGSALIRVVSGGVPQEFNADPEVRLVADVVP